MRIRRQAEADGVVRKMEGKEQIIDTVNQVVATAFSAAPAGKTRGPGTHRTKPGSDC